MVKKLFSILVLFSFAIVGCDMFNSPLKPFIDRATNVAVPHDHYFLTDYYRNDGFIAIPPEQETSIRIPLRNPRGHGLELSMEDTTGKVAVELSEDGGAAIVRISGPQRGHVFALTLGLQDPVTGRPMPSYSLPRLETRFLNAYLHSLSVKSPPGTLLSPGFSSGHTSYTVTLPPGTPYIYITAALPSGVYSTATLIYSGGAVPFSGGTISRQIVMPSGTNTITIEVTAESGFRRTYTLTTIEGTCDEHIFGEWVVTTPATCTEAGVETRTCQHADCQHYETRPIPALGHDWGEWVVTTPPTSTEAGVETKTCARCGTTETRPIPALDHNCDNDGHVMGNWVVTTPATCTTDGVETRTCQHADCQHYETRPIPALGHDWGEWVVTTLPTTTTEGVETRTCARCGTTETRPIPALDHNCDSDGHIMGDWVITTPATCTTDGVETRTCLHVDCQHYETRPIPALGHDWGEWVVTTLPTTTTDGVETRTCARCGTTETRPIPVLPLPQLTGTVTITGTAHVGQTLTANTTGLYGTGAISFQWYRADTLIPDATAASYTVQDADTGYTITVRVMRAGYYGYRIGGPTAPVINPIGTGNITISFPDLVGMAPGVSITGPTIRLVGTPEQTSAVISVTDFGRFDSISWFFQGELLSGSMITGGSGETITLSPRLGGSLLGLGTHFLTVEVTYNGVPFERQITFTVVL